jgi:hypothetical protein
VVRKRTLTTLEIEYELTPQDLYAFQWRAVFASPRGRRARRKVYLLWLLVVLLLAAVPAIGADGFAISRVNFIFIVVAFPIVVVFQWFLERRLVRGAILQLLKEEKPSKGLLGKHRMVMSEDGLFESTEVGESRVSWAGVDRIEQNPEYIFIYTSAVGAHVIPKRAFRDMLEAEDFYRRALVFTES